MADFEYQRHLQFNRPSKVKSAEERRRPSDSESREDLRRHAARSEDGLNSASFIPKDWELKELISRITPLNFQSLVPNPVERTALLLGSIEISRSDDGEIHTLNVNGRLKDVAVVLNSGRIRDVITSGNSVIRSTPAGILGVQRGVPDGRAFFTYTLTSCQEPRLCFTTAQRRYSFEAASKHNHLLFLRRASNVFAAGEMGVYGPPDRPPTLIVMNRLSGTVMRPLIAKNPGVAFDRVVELAAKQFWGEDWDVRSVRAPSAGDAGAAEIQHAGLASLIRSAQSGGLQRKLVVVGEFLPVFDQEGDLGPPPNATGEMSIEQLTHWFPESVIGSSLLGMNALLKQIAVFKEFVNGAVRNLKARQLTASQNPTPANRNQVKIAERRLATLDDVNYVGYDNDAVHYKESIGSLIEKEKAALSDLLELPVTHYPFTLSDLAAFTRVKEAETRAEQADQLATEIGVDVDVDTDTDTGSRQMVEAMHLVAEAARHTAAAEKLAADAALQEKLAAEEARAVAFKASRTLLSTAQPSQSAEERLALAERHVAALDAEERQIRESRAAARRLEKREALRRRMSRVSVWAAERLEEEKEAEKRVATATIAARRVAADAMRVSSSFPAKRRKTGSA